MLISLFSCSKKEQQTSTDEAIKIVLEQKNVHESPEASEPKLTEQAIEAKTKNAIKKYKTLYAELKKMRHNSAFHFHCFGPNSPARTWKQEVEQLEAESGQLLFSKGLIAGDLIMLAIEWADNKGRNTETSKAIQKDIDINLKKIDK